MMAGKFSIYTVFSGQLYFSSLHLIQHLLKLLDRLILQGFILLACKNGHYLLLLLSRVFEALGSRMRLEDSEEQLSGVGFSATKRNDVLVKVNNRHRYKLVCLHSPDFPYGNIGRQKPLHREILTVKRHDVLVKVKGASERVLRVKF